MTTTAAQEGVISMQNYENVGQYLRRIYHHLWSRINIMSSAGTRVDHWYHRSLPLLPLDLLVPDIWICLETAFGFVFENIYISPGFNFPYFRSSPLSISPCWMASYFPVKLPRKKNHFWRGLHLKQMYEILFSRGAKIESVKPKWAFLLLLQNKGLCGNAHVRRQFWQSSWSLHLFTESTSGRKWTTSRRLAPQCPPIASQLTNQTDPPSVSGHLLVTTDHWPLTSVTLKEPLKRGQGSTSKGIKWFTH